MRITNIKHTKRNILIAAGVVVLLSGTAAALFIPNSPFAINKPKGDRPENTVDYKKPTDAEKKAGDKAKEDFVNKAYGNDSDNNSSNSDGGESTNTNGAASITISSANVNNGTLQLRTIISEITSSGSCKLTLEKSGRSTVTQDAGTQTLGSYSVCKGFDIPTSSLSSGQWKATVVYTDQAGKTSSAIQTVDI